MKTIQTKDCTAADQPKQSKETEKTFATSTGSTSIRAALRSIKGEKRGIYVRVTINRQSEYYPTGYYVDPTNFDNSSGLVKGGEENKEGINSYLRYLINEL